MSRRSGWTGGLSLTLLAGALSFPLVWAVTASFRPEADLFRAPALLPSAIVVDHYRALFVDRAFWMPLRNSLVVASATTALALLVGAPCAYALARLRFRGKGPLLAFVLSVSVFPQVSIVSPLYLVLRTLRLIDTYPGLVVPYVTFAMPLTVWLLVGYFRDLPVELEEAARVDGASRLRIFREVVAPLALPGLVTTALLTFVYCWNEFLFALSFTLGPERQTVPVAIALFRGQYRIPWGEILAAAAVSTAPVSLIVLVFQRRIVRGLTSGAVKG